MCERMCGVGYRWVIWVITDECISAAHPSRHIVSLSNKLLLHTVCYYTCVTKCPYCEVMHFFLWPLGGALTQTAEHRKKETKIPEWWNMYITCFYNNFSSELKTSETNVEKYFRKKESCSYEIVRYYVCQFLFIFIEFRNFWHCFYICKAQTVV